jgi:hypothetical protein
VYLIILAVLKWKGERRYFDIAGIQHDTKTVYQFC